MGKGNNGWAINISELEALRGKLEKAGADMEAVAKKAISAAWPIVREKMSQTIPRSVTPRLRTKSEPWRTGIHAADSLAMQRPKFNINLRRSSVYSLVGPSRLYAHERIRTSIPATGRHFYMWYVVRGYPTRRPGAYVKGRPYVRAVMSAVRSDVQKVMQDIMLKELLKFNG